MRFVKYFLGRYIVFICPLAAAVLSPAISFIIRGDISMFNELFIPLSCVLFAMRTNDDMWDYEKDASKRKIYLGRTELFILTVLFSAAFAVYSILCYGARGMLALLFLPYITAWEKIPFMKLFFAPLMFLYYCTSEGTSSVWTYVIGCAVFLILPGIYHFIKKESKK